MKTLKIELGYLNPTEKKYIECVVESIYTDLYKYNEFYQQFDEEQINFHWLNYLAEKQINTKGYYLHSYTIL